MLKELIDKLKRRKEKIETLTSQKEDIIKEKDTFEETKNNINITQEGNIYKIEFSDYISFEDFDKLIKLNTDYNILDLICLTVSWNSNEKKANKGIYYVISFDNYLYNIFINNNKVIIDERKKIDFDEIVQKENITRERVITYYFNENTYHYYCAKHDSNRDTYSSKYYNKNRKYSMGALDLSDDEAYKEISSVISNLENIEDIENIIDLDLLKNCVLNDIGEDSIQLKKNL